MFAAGSRVTSVEMEQKYSKRRNVPGPGSYKIKPPKIFGGNEVTKSKKTPMFIDAALEHAAQVPAVPYKNVDALLNARRKALSVKMTAPGPKKSWRAKKETGKPDCGTYNPMKSFLTFKTPTPIKIS